VAATYRFEQMTWPGVSKAAAARRVALQPMGAIERHGPGLPVGTGNGSGTLPRFAEGASSVRILAGGFDRHDFRVLAHVIRVLRCSSRGS
jgi:Creatinine amidohydrolase